MAQLGESARGSPVMSSHGEADNLAARRGAFNDMPDELLKPLQSPGVVSLDVLQNLRSRASEMAYKAGMSGDQRLASAAGQIREHLDGALEATAGRAAMRQVLGDGVDVPQAMYRKGLGEIDFLNGQPGKLNSAGNDLNKGYGVSYLVNGRNLQGQDGRSVAMSMPDILSHGKVGGVYENGKKVNISLPDGSTAVLRNDLNGNAVKWLLTGWNDPVGKVSDGLSGVFPSQAYTQPSSVIGRTVGADARSIGVPGEYFHPDMALAQRQARQARTDQGDRFETGFAGRLWQDGHDGMPKLTGGEIPRAAFNNGATQTQDINQWGLMGRPGADALKNYAITNLVESALLANGTLSANKANRWTQGRSEAIKGLLSEPEQKALANVVADAQRASNAETLGRASGSNTAQNFEGGLLFSKPLDWAARLIPVVGKDGVDALRQMQKRRLGRDMQSLLLDPQAMARALGPRQFDPFYMPEMPAGGLLGLSNVLQANP